MEQGPIPIYERIGDGYAQRRRPDPRWLAQIHRALASDNTILNVGAGSGSYEPVESDIEDGTWYGRYSELTALGQLDLGYRLVVADS